MMTFDADAAVASVAGSEEDDFKNWLLSSTMANLNKLTLHVLSIIWN